MAENELDAFLKGDAAEAEPAPVEKSEAAPEPKADASGGGARLPPDAKAEADDTDDEPFIEDVANFRRLREIAEATKKERQDWKRQAIEAQTQRDELRRQVEEAKRTQPPQQQPVYQQPIDPNTHPQEFVQRIQGVVLNERLNVSEMMLRKELGAEKVDELIAEFKQAAQQDETLFPKLYAQPDPYGWVAKQVEKIRLQRDIGDDPAAYRAKLRAEFEAEIAANGGAAQPQRTSPAAGMAPSLATARSVAGRSAAAFTGPPSLDDILALRK